MSHLPYPTLRSLRLPSAALALLHLIAGCSDDAASMPTTFAGAMNAGGTGGDPAANNAGAPQGGDGMAAAGSGGIANGGTAGAMGGAGGAIGGSAGAGGETAGAGGETAGAGGALAGAGGLGGDGGAGGMASSCEASTGMAMAFHEGVIDQMTGFLGDKTPSGDEPRTLELWAKFIGVSSWTAEQTIIELGRPMGPDCVWGIDMSGRDGGTGAYFGPYTNGVTDSNGTSGPHMLDVAADVGWLHLAWAYEGNGGPMQFTVNGEQLQHQDPGNNYTLNLTPGIVTLGASQAFGATGWEGVMDEVRIWSTFRSVQEIQDNMRVLMKGDEPGLAAYWNFDDATPEKVPEIGGDDMNALYPCEPGASNRCTIDQNNAAPEVVESDIPGDWTCSE